MKREDLAPPLKQFRLLRYFSLTSLVGVLVVLASLIYFYRHFALEALEEHETRDNVAVTHHLANKVWPVYAAYVKSAAELSPAELRSRPEVARIRQDILQQIDGMSVVKIKIYALNGMTVFSTDEKQIGEDKSDDEGFIDARNGKAVSEIAFENHFDSFEKVINDRNLISTYIPIRASEAQAPEGVFEVYSDVTDYVVELRHTTAWIVVLVMGSLSLLYSFLYAIVWRADRALRAQGETVSRAHRAMLAHQALHDPLTGLPNRANLSERLDGMLRTHQRSGAKCAVLYIGLDGFKAINDSLGHVAGDEVLQEVARRLLEQFRSADIVARMGGDEFLIALADLTDEFEIESIVETTQRLQRIISDAPVQANEHALALTASIGVAIWPEDGASVVELLKSADAALLHAKKSGRNSYKFHTADMNDRALEMLLIERDLRRALDEDQFVLHYQPQMNLASGQIIGAEALIRWQHPERGLLPPGQFIGVAEERGLIIPLGEWVLHEACRQMHAWRQAGLPAIPIAINLAAPHFAHQHLLEKVTDNLQRYQLEPGCLELELTESSVMHDAASTVATMHALKEAGLLLALDDFGTGYSSLSQLKAMPFDYLKLDQSFVRGLPDNSDDLAICSTIIAMGQTLGLKVIAEGVETPAQLQILRELACDNVQGFLLSRPLPAASFPVFLQAGARHLLASA
ncbi:EAL domain-containing protein [Niveibacterium sp. SC-1]|uniref:putative bifunctional diguanylate cyclase/phosphodiesterase n=1 Tax=Niveibacterium sp. SC-1 TaxID=3135646 RepID=UPI00311EE435